MASDTGLVVNGRFLRQRRPTGLHRVARALIGELRRAGVALSVFAPVGVVDPLADRLIAGPPGRFGDHLWEQAVLPIVAGRRSIVSLANTAPLVKSRAAVMVHDLAQWVEPRWFAPEMRLYGALVLSAAKRARVVLCPTRQVARELVAAGIDRRRVAVVRNGVDPGVRRASSERISEIASRLGLDGPYVVHVGWANPQKNVATAIAAHSRALRHIEHRLVLVGAAHPSFAPVDLPPLRTLCVTGWISDEDLWALLSGACALLCPSFYEGFGLPAVEAMACGCPVLAADIPSLRESTAGGATYLVADDVAAWADGIVAALRGDLPPPRPLQWSWADAGRQLLAALEPLL